MQDVITIDSILELVKQKLYSLNAVDALEPYVSRLGIDFTFPGQEEEKSFDDANPKGKVVIIGDSGVKTNNLYGMLKEKYNLTNDYLRKHFELVFDYDSFNHYDFTKLSKQRYSVILVGPMPHSITGRGDNSSMITNLENNQDFYPPVYRLDQSSPISKSSLSSAINDLVNKGLIDFS